jgi:hypothetical protein
MEAKIAYIISLIIFFLGVGLMFYKINLGIIGIVVSIAIATIQYALQKKSDQLRHEEFQQLAVFIHESSEAKKKLQSLKELMKRKNISIRKIIEKFDNPLFSIFIYKFNERPRGKKNAPTPLKDLIEKSLNFKVIGNSFYMLLPQNMPNIKRKFNLDKWCKDYIISKLPKNATYTLNFVALVDLRKIFCFKTVNWGNTVFDVLTQDPTFLAKLIESLTEDKIMPKDLMKDYTVGDIITLKLSEAIIMPLKKNSIKILHNLNCDHVTELCDVPSNDLKNEFSKYINQNVQEITNNIIQNSKALKEVIEV